jgi:hypothetical protein
MTLGSTSWSQSLSYCPTITYSLVDSTLTTTADSIFSISGTSVIVSTTSTAKVGTYIINVKG